MNFNQKITLFNLERYKRRDDAKIVDHKEMFVAKLILFFMISNI